MQTLHNAMAMRARAKRQIQIKRVYVYIYIYVQSRISNAHSASAYVMFTFQCDRQHEYHYKGREPYVQLSHAVYARFDTLPLSFYILLFTVYREKFFGPR